MKYGLPYQGSKSRIAKDIISFLPRGERLVDLFAGGCAITHAAILSGKWARFLANDLDTMPVRCFKAAIQGKYRHERRWISKEDFLRLKEKDEYVRYCFSFGNDGSTYMYGSKIEPYKKACHMAVVFDDWREFEALCPEVAGAAKESADCVGSPDDMNQIHLRRLSLGPTIVKELKRLASVDLLNSNPLYRSCHRKKTDGGGVRLQLQLRDLESLESLQSLESLERLQSLESLERLQRLQSLQFSSNNYGEYEHQDGDVVYCDPPYANTSTYSNLKFDSERFWEWVRGRDYVVYVSEYTAPKDFTSVFSKSVCRLKNQYGADGKAIENIFVHRRFAECCRQPDHESAVQLELELT